MAERDRCGEHDGAGPATVGSPAVPPVWSVGGNEAQPGSHERHNTTRVTAIVELQLRDARLTDIDRITGLLERAQPDTTSAELAKAADFLRQLVYLPNAAVMVALDGRSVVGAAVLALRPSVAAGGHVGTVDLLLVEPGHELDGVGRTLLEELIRSARNKGCVTIDGPVPDDPNELALWERLGFAETGVRLSRALTRERTTAR
jgi:GNAT superfamily N-acetyltransferase